MWPGWPEHPLSTFSMGITLVTKSTLNFCRRKQRLGWLGYISNKSAISSIAHYKQDHLWACNVGSKASKRRLVYPVIHILCYVLLSDEFLFTSLSPDGILHVTIIAVLCLVILDDKQPDNISKVKVTVSLSYQAY